MRLFFEALKARGISADTGKRIKYWGKWNNQLERLRAKEPNMQSFDFPAVFFEFQSPLDVTSVGNGVQVYDPVYVRIHVLHKFLNNVNGGNELNLDFYDVGKDVHSWFQDYQVQGADYGSSPLNRTSVEEDEDHDMIYHYVPVYTTVWVDNSQKLPKGGYEIAPVLDAGITGQVLVPDVAALIASLSSIDFGIVNVGTTATRTFTLTGHHLPQAPIIVSTTDGIFQLSLDAVTYKTRLGLYPDDTGEFIETTITVKFTPLVSGGHNGSILFGVPGINGSIAITGSGGGFLLNDTGGYILQEDGSKILL